MEYKVHLEKGNSHVYNENQQEEYQAKDIILARHAKAVVNVHKKSAKHHRDYERLNGIKYDTKYIDSEISEEGWKGIEIFSEKMKDLNIKYVLVSPLKRAMHTAIAGLQEHPNFENIKFVIFPCLKACLTATMDMTSMSLEELKESYERQFPGVNLTFDTYGIDDFGKWEHNLTTEQLNDIDFHSHIRNIFNDSKNYYLHLFDDTMQK